MSRYLTLWIGFHPKIAQWIRLLLYIHLVGRTCVVTASPGSPCCPKCFNWWSDVATYIHCISNWVNCIGPPYVGIGSKQGGYLLCPGSVACLWCEKYSCPSFIAASTMCKKSCGSSGPVFVASCPAGSPRWTVHRGEPAWHDVQILVHCFPRWEYKI